MKTLKILLAVTFMFVMTIGNAYAQVTIAEDDSDLLNLQWTRAKIEKMLAGTPEERIAINSAVDDIIKAIEAANALMVKFFNPDVLDVTSIYLEDNLLTVGYAVGRTEILVHVYTDTYVAYFDMYKGDADAALRTREDIERKMGLEDKGGVHINSIERLCRIIENQYDENSTLIIAPYDVEYRLTARVDNYTLTLDYRGYYPGLISYVPLMPSITLTSFVDNETERDYVEEAQDAVLDLFNPGEHNIGVSYWTMQDGILRLTMDLFHDVYPIKYRINATISVDIDLGTGEITIDERIVDAVKGAREETARGLGIDINDVHVNGIGLYWEDEDRIIYHIYPQPILPMPTGYILSVSTLEFDLTYKYSFADGSLTLTSLRNKDGVDLLKNAINYLKDIFNPTSYRLVNLGNGDGCLAFVFKLPGWARILKLNINIETGELMPNFAKLVEVIMNARSEITQRMGVDISDVHVNGAAEEYDHEAGLYIVTKLIISLNEYIFTYVDAKDGRGMRLEAIYNSRTDQDLLENAINYLKEILNPDEFELAGWGYSDSQEGVLEFRFRLQDGSIINVVVDIKTGEPWIDGSLKNAALNTREHIERKMGLEDKGGVHINGICVRREGYSFGRHYELTARVDHYNLTLTYSEYPTLWDSFLPGKVYRITLTSFVDNNTGQDLFKSARRHLEDMFNGRSNDVTNCTDWGSVENNLAKFTFRLQDGSTVEARVDCNGTVREVVKTKEGYFKNTHRTINVSEWKYDENGTLRERKEIYNRYYGTTDILWFSSETTLTYDESGKLTSKAYVARSYNGNGVLVKARSTFELYNANGVKIYSSESVTNYDLTGAFVNSYCINSNFDDSGKLVSKTATIFNVSESGVIQYYTVTYDIDENGNIIHTHVYDIEGNEVENLSGDGFMHPTDIIEDINNLPSDLSEYLDVYDENLLNEDVLQRIAIEQEAKKQVGDPRFVGEMADEILSLQRKR